MAGLKEQVQKKDQYAKLVLEQQLKNLAGGKKSEWDKKHPSKQTRGKSAHKNLQTNKVEHLLEIIDHYKGKLLTADEEITNLKRQKFLLEQDVKVKDKRFTSMQEENSAPSSFN